MEENKEFKAGGRYLIEDKKTKFLDEITVLEVTDNAVKYIRYNYENKYWQYKKDVYKEYNIVEELPNTTPMHFYYPNSTFTPNNTMPYIITLCGINGGTIDYNPNKEV